MNVRGLAKRFKLSWRLGYWSGYAAGCSRKIRTPIHKHHANLSQWVLEKCGVYIPPDEIEALNAVDKNGVHTVESYLKEKDLVKSRKKR